MRPDMTEAVNNGQAMCATYEHARWTRSDMLSTTREYAIASAVLARALVFVRPGPLVDKRLRVGRGDERWVDESLDAATQSARDASLTDVALASIDDAHQEVRYHLKCEAQRVRSEGDVKRANFIEGCADRVEPIPIKEIPPGLIGEQLTDSDFQLLETATFRRDTTIQHTDPPPTQERPSAFPAHLPTPTCAADFLLKEVTDACFIWPP